MPARVDVGIDPYDIGCNFVYVVGDDAHIVPWHLILQMHLHIRISIAGNNNRKRR